jgi:cold shock CspA family protein
MFEGRGRQQSGRSGATRDEGRVIILKTPTVKQKSQAVPSPNPHIRFGEIMMRQSMSGATPRYRGRLAKWHGSYGFIRFQERDVFVHLSNFLGGFHPELNAEVEFQLGPPAREDKKEEAVLVRVVRSYDYTAGLQRLRDGAV